MKLAHPSVRRLVLPALSLLAAVRLAAAPAPVQQPVPDQLDLKTAIGFAIENNFAIRQARERIRQQDGILITVRAQQIPNLNANASYQYMDSEIATSAVDTNRAWAANVVASQLLFAGGGAHYSVKSAKLVREAAILDMKSVINDALLGVRTAYYNVLLTREKIKVQESNLELLQQQLKTTTDRFEAGTVSSFERLRAEVAVANAKVPLITARNDFRLAIEAMRQQLGYTANDPQSLQKIPTFAGTLDYTPTNFDLPSAFEAAHTNRPDLQRLQKLTESRDAQVTVAKSNYYPDLVLQGGYQLRKGATNRLWDSRDGFFVGLSSSWSIFDGRATHGRVVQAKSILTQSQLAFSEAQLAVEAEVRRAFSTWQQAVELVEASQKVVAQAEEAVRLANARYSAGTSTQLDVLQVQVDLTTARTNQVQANYNYNVAVAELRRAVGLGDSFVTTN